MHNYWKKPVSILTDVTAKRRFPCLRGFLVVLVISASTVANAAETQWHPIEEIAAAAEAYLKLTVGPSNDRIVPTAGHLDPRLRLPLCDETLDPYLRPGAKTTGRTIVGVRCPGTKPWKVYLPVYVAVMDKVLVAQNAMPRGHVINAEDLEIATRDVSGLVGGYLSRSDEILGQRLKRAVNRGAVILPSLLQVETLIKKGQSVVLTVNNNSINIRMSGIALMDGAVNQRIRVQNTRSGLVVEGLVRSAEQVEVLVN